MIPTLQASTLLDILGLPSSNVSGGRYLVSRGGEGFMWHNASPVI